MRTFILIVIVLAVAYIMIAKAITMARKGTRVWPFGPKGGP